MRKLWIAFTVVITIGLSQPFTLAEESTIRAAVAVRVEEPPTIDGVVQEEIWNRAEPLTDFIQAEPLEGQPATEKTEVRILYDDQAIYFGVICYDSDPSQIIVTDARRDAGLTDTDSFRIILDTYHDRQNGFVFGTNPAGIEYDGQVSNEGEGAATGGSPTIGGARGQVGSGGGFNLNWDTSWQVRTHTNEVGWMAEFAIPLRSLRYGAGKPQVWGLNFHRNIRRKREEIYWSPVSRAFNLYRLSSAGDLRNLELETPRNFKVTPYALGSAARNFPTEDQIDYDGAWGVDAKFGVTPSLNLDVTYNTDFAQVEVDEQQINLTRFRLFFPEKRSFFLENAGNFSMGKTRQVELFFSRRIGIDPLGVLVPIVAGARLSGKAGRYNVGFLNMQTENILGITPPNNFTVASLSREFPNRSSLGAMFVNRTATGDLAGPNNWNRTFGFNGKLGVGESFTLNGFAARTQTPRATGREHSFDLKGEYLTNATRIYMNYTEVGEDFNPEVGFLLRDDYRAVDTAVWTFNRFPGISWFRELRPHVNYRAFWNFDGFKETEITHIDVHFDFENGYYFSPAVNLTYEGLKEPFEIYPGIVVPPGTYKNSELAWRWNTNTAAMFYYSGGLDYGGFLSGNQSTWATTVGYRYRSTFITSVNWVYTDIDLLEGSFTTNLAQFRFTYNFTPFTNIQSLIQYNTSINTWSSNIRFSWLNTAGTGLFVVYNDTEGLGDLLLGPQNRTFIVKYTRQFDIFR